MTLAGRPASGDRLSGGYRRAVTMLTRWGRDLDPERVLPEHPRPQLVRDGWLNLNGWWDYAVTPATAHHPPARP